MSDNPERVLSQAAMDGLSRDESGTWLFSAAGLKNLETAFSDVVAKGSDVAVPAIRDLARFALFMEKKQGSKETADKIFGIINTLRQVIESHGLEMKRVQPESRQKKAAEFLGALPKVGLPGMQNKEESRDEEDSAEEKTFKAWSFRNK